MFQEELGVFCVPLPDFLALNFSSSNRSQQNGIIIQPTNTETNQNQRQITVQRIGRDARPLLPCEIARYQHMFTSNRPEASRRSETQNVPETRTARVENSRLRSLAQRMPRLNHIGSSNSDFRVIPWSERSRLQMDRLDQDYVLRLPVLDISRMQNNRGVNPAPVNPVNNEAGVNNQRPTENSELEYN